MKLKSIEIRNMHQIATSKKYNLNDITYFTGPNGIGKSTVLQAIQLALLGYIPGYDKTNAGILKHSNDGTSLAVTAELENDGNTYVIIREWKKSGSSVKSATQTSPADFDVKSILGNIELPVFNFNEFRGMTANKLKEWFINFLPKEQFSIDWKEYLTAELGARSALLSDELLESTLTYIQDDLGSKSGVDLVKSLNEWFKNQQSFEKSTVSRLQDTINSLIYYQDVESVDEEAVRAQIVSLRDQRDALIRYDAQQKSVQDIKDQLAHIELPADSFVDDPDIKQLEAQVAHIDEEIADVSKKHNEADTKYKSLSAQLIRFNITSDICPYTKSRCAEISAKITEMNAEKQKVTDAMTAMTSELSEYVSQLRKLQLDRHSCEHNIDSITERYRLADMLKKSLPTDLLECPTSKSVADLDTELSELQSQISKIEANKQFKQLNETITKDKYRAENNLEVLKIWINSTGANGLQTYMMEKPFETLAADLSSYLSKMYGKDVVGKFNLEEKANSFSFGMTSYKSGSFVEFDLLSSGEKCLFTIALIMCLINRSDSTLKLLLADDILDHLDDENADRVFSGLTSEGIQFVMAGVKTCKNTDVCIEIKGE